MTRIYHNISAMQAVHRLGTNNNMLAQSMERLSSGLRINRAKDDPAGLIASERLRSEIAGIGKAISNSERASNVISTAEGGLNELSALLVDLRELVTETANEGGLSESEIEANQLQVDSIIESIDRIANTTQFNGKKLLNGSMAYDVTGVTSADVDDLKVYGAKVPEGASLTVNVEVTASANLAIDDWTTGSTLADVVSIRVQGNLGTQVFSFDIGASATDIKTAVNQFRDETGVSAVISNGDEIAFTSTEYGSRQYVSVDTISGTFATSGAGTKQYGVDATVTVNGTSTTVDGLEVTSKNTALDLEIDLSASMGTAIGNTSFSITGGGARFQLSPETNMAGMNSVAFLDTSASALGNSSIGFLSDLKRGGTAAFAEQKYYTSQRIVEKAIEQTSTLRGRLGAFQKNIIETNINSQSTALENVTASESKIRDADFADETANMTRAQILVQSTTSVLSIANSLPQSALSLLG